MSETGGVANRRLPGEWERQRAVWFAWPTDQTLWKGCFEKVRAQLIELYLIASRFQTVRVLCPQTEQVRLQAVYPKIAEQSSIEFFDYQTDDIWIRDFGPLFLKEIPGSKKMAVDFRFNAWGKKYPNYIHDDEAGRFICKRTHSVCLAYDVVMEGGALESNGDGCLMTTEAVLLNSNRGSNRTRETNEAILTEAIGAKSFIWLKGGLEGDDTDGHIDNLARYTSANSMLVAKPDAKCSANFAQLSENRDRLNAAVDLAGQKFEVIDLVMPDPVYHKGRQLAASYLNFLVLNGSVLVPQFGQSDKDTVALTTISEAFPTREILGIDCQDIVKEGGGLHCLSLNEFN